MLPPLCTRVILLMSAGMADLLRMEQQVAIGFLYHLMLMVLSLAICTSRSRMGIQPKGWLEG
jgi:hypothetical protein